MKLSLFSVSYAGYWGQHQLSLREFLGKAAELGYDGVMLAGKRPHLSPLDVDADARASIRATLDELGLTCAVVAGYTDLRSAQAAEVPFLEMQIAYVDALATAASDLGASIIRIFTAYDSSDAGTSALWPNVVSTLQEICDRTADRGVTLAVQNHHDLALHSDALIELLHDVDRSNCKLGFDAWSPALRGEDLYSSAKKMAPHAVITTNADYILLPRYRYLPELVNYQRCEPDMVRAVRFGEGFIDYPAFFQGLADGGFDGWYSYEMCSPVRGGGAAENLDGCAAHYVNWMRAHQRSHA